MTGSSLLSLPKLALCLQAPVKQQMKQGRAFNINQIVLIYINIK